MAWRMAKILTPPPGGGWPEGPGEEFGQKPENQYTLTDLHQGYP